MDTFSNLSAIAAFTLALCSCQTSADHHHHTATAHHGKNIPSDCTAVDESHRQPNSADAVGR